MGGQLVAAAPRGHGPADVPEAARSALDVTRLPGAKQPPLMTSRVLSQKMPMRSDSMVRFALLASYRWSWLPPPCHGSPYIRMFLPHGRASSAARSSFMVSTS